MTCTGMQLDPPSRILLWASALVLLLGLLVHASGCFSARLPDAVIAPTQQLKMRLSDTESLALKPGEIYSNASDRLEFVLSESAFLGLLE